MLICQNRDMITSAAAPDLAIFRQHARERRVIPVTWRVSAVGETPVSLYRKLADERPGTFLLESAEYGDQARYSFIGVRCMATLVERDGQARWLGTPPGGLPTKDDPLAAVRTTLEVLRMPRDSGHLPPLVSGLVGYLGYDMVRRLERIPTLAADDLRLPELALMLVTDLAVLDHRDNTVLLVANAILDDSRPAEVDDAYSAAMARLDAMIAEVNQPVSPEIATFDTMAEPNYTAQRSSEQFQVAVTAAKERIHAGEAFQIVLSQRFEMRTSASALDIYRALRAINPSPYMYLMRFPAAGDGATADQAGFDIIGSSPEALVKVAGNQAMVRPIAGARWRGITDDADDVLAAELLADPKERAEHVMLVDLGRNDLGRVCVPGSVEVSDFMTIERYSHVMHIVSTVTGRVTPGRTAWDVLTACFPAGTLSGAPKPRAMELIEELEPTRRGLYGGAVGYFDFAGDADAAIAIRTALLRDGTAYVQAGAGIVADSQPDYEDRECHHKAAAALRAIAAASSKSSAR